MTEIEQEHAQAIDLTAERIKRLEKDMAHLDREMQELKTMLASFMKSVANWQNCYIEKTEGKND